MIGNYLKVAWRNILRNKLFSAINILGLSLGTGLAFIIMMYVQDELSYDRFNTNAPNMARVIFQANVNGGKINESVTMAPVVQTLKNDYPEVTDATRIIPANGLQIVYNDQVFKDDRFVFADPNVFDIFTLPFTEGDPGTALALPNTVVITETTAKKYFGAEKATGKVLTLAGDNPQPYRVTGVMKDIPANSHFHFDMFGSMKGYSDATSDSWMSGGYRTYLLLKPGTDLKSLESRFPAMVKKYMGPQIQQKMGLSLEQFTSKGNSLGFILQPLTDIHLNAHTSNEFEPGGNKMYVYIFSGVALFILIVAAINFVNLSTAGASKRAREVGVRKAAGSGRFQLISQFLSESLLVTFLALFIAFAFIKFSLPAFNHFSGKELRFDFLQILIFAGLGAIVGVLAGLYPAFYLSSFKPVAVLKGKLTPAINTFGLRSSLVVFQFFVSVSLIIATTIVYRQMKYIQNKDLGYDKEQLITLPNSYALGNNEQVYKQQLLQDPRIVNATSSWFKPAGPSNYNNALAYPQENDQLIVNGVDYQVDDQYIPTMGMQMISGRNFSKDFKTDDAAIIINETAAKALGWTSETALNKSVIIQNSSKGQHYPFHVVGVVKNFNFKSLHEAISPLYMTYDPQGGLIFKVNTTDMTGLLATMKNKWEEYKTGEPFTYSFMDDMYNRLYAAEQKTATVLNIFSLLTIFVACLGLFGLATYTAEQRTKEIGIRKVLGASVNQIIGMLSKEFLKLVLIASLMAFPIAWWAMNQWLKSFAYRVDISWWIFAIAALAALIIALLTVSWQAVKAALANPVKSLRSE